MLRLLTMQFCLLAALDSGARELYECARAGAPRSFQDVPCGESDVRQSVRVLPDHAQDLPAREAERVARASAALEREDAALVARFERAALAGLPESLGGRPAPARSGRAAHAPRREASSPCEQARAKRDLAYRRDGNRMGFERRRALQDAQDEACGL